MRKYYGYTLLSVFLLLLVFIGRIGRNLLDWVVGFFDIASEPAINIYVIVLSACMMIAGVWTLLSLKRSRLDNLITFIKLVFVGVLLGFGSLWLYIAIARFH